MRHPIVAVVSLGAFLRCVNHTDGVGAATS
jgi:hypothetical protein